MASFGIYDGTDDEPEDVRLAREAREAVEKELAEAAAAESQKFRDTNPFSDGVTTGADGGSGPFNLAPFNVIGVRETEPERIAKESLEGDPFFGGSSGGAGSLATTTNVTVPTSVLPVQTMSPVYVPASYGDPKLDKLQSDELARLNRVRVAAGFPPYTELTARNDNIGVFLADHVKTQRPIQDAKDDKDAEEAKIYAAQVEAKRLNDLNPLGPIFRVVKSAATGAWEVIKDPAQGLSNVATNIGEIFNPDSNSNTNVVSLPVDPVTGAVLTAVQLANANDVTRATTALNTAKAAAAQGRRNGVSEEEQADLDDEVVNRQGILDTARGKTASQGGAAGVVTAIGAAAAGGTAAGTGAGAGGAAAGGAGASAGATQTTTPTNVAVGGVFDQKTLDAVAAARTQAQAIAAAQTTPPTNVVTPAPINGADILRQTQVGLNPAPIFEQPAATTTPTDWTKADAARTAAAQAGQTAQTQAIAGMGVATPTTTKQNPDGTFVVGGGGGGTNKCPDGSDRPANGICPVIPVTPPAGGGGGGGGGTNKCPDGSDRPANGICPVIPSTCPAGQEKVNGTCVARCSAGQERNAQGVCVVPPVNPPPGTTTIDPTLILPIPSNPFTMSTITADQRDLYTELGDTTDAFKRRRNALRDVYGDALGDYSNADMDAYERISGRMRGTNVANTEAASAQTIAANRALRDANLADVNRLGGAAKLNRETLNSQLYGNLNQYSKEASSALGRDMDALRLAEAKQLSPEDIRNSQQAAREAWSARGLVNSRGAVGAEILNRDSLARQREAEARAKVQQSYGNLQQATAMEMANVFDPQAAILGGQYGMQTQNYGTNAALYGQSAEQTRGSQDYVRKVFNPMGEYPNNVYDFNANATTAARIAAANNEAAVAAAREAGQYGLVGTALKSGFVQDALTGVWKWVTRGS